MFFRICVCVHACHSLESILKTNKYKFTVSKQIKIYYFYYYFNLFICKLHLSTRWGIHNARIQTLTGFGVFPNCLASDLA